MISISLAELEVQINNISVIVEAKPKIGLSHVLQVIKSISAQNFLRLRPEIKKKHLGVGKLWAQSCIVKIIGSAT